VLPFLKNRPRTPKPSNAALREQTEKAIKAFTGAITKELTCKHCGHGGTAHIPTDRAGAVLYCRECGCTV
jgi:transcription elongation factor Elf1